MLDKPLRAHGTFKTRYDVPDRRRPEQVLRQTSEHENETGDIPDPREPYVDLLSSTGWDMATRFVIIPYAKRVRQALLKHADLSEIERQRLVGSLATLEHIVEELYKRADEKPPGWVVETFS